MVGSNFNNSSVTADNQIKKEKQVALLAMATLAVIENVIVLLSIATSRKLRREITYVFVLSLLASQALVSSVTIPMYCFAQDNFLFGFVTALTIFAYILSFCAVTYERYIALCQSIFYNSKMTRAKARKLVCWSWLTSFVIELVPVFWKGIKDEQKYDRIYIGINAFLFLILPLIFIWYWYAFISYAILRINCNHGTEPVREPTLQHITSLWKRTMDQANQQHVGDCLHGLYLKSRDRKSKQPFIYGIYHSPKSVTKVTWKPHRSTRSEVHLAMIFGMSGMAYTMTWIPVIILNVYDVFNKNSLAPRYLAEVSVYLLAFNAMLDPLLYGLLLRGTRARIKYIINEVLGFICKHRQKSFMEYAPVDTNIVFFSAANVYEQNV